MKPENILKNIFGEVARKINLEKKKIMKRYIYYTSSLKCPRVPT